MGTTADKLQAIIDSKEAIRTAINDKGGSVLESTPLDEYATAIDNLPSIDSLIDGSITTINSNVTTIKAYKFYQTNITTANLPEVTSILTNAFDGCSSLTSINIPKAVMASTVVNCFRNCSNLPTIQLDEATFIGQGCFMGCSSLTSATFKKVYAIGMTAFKNCTSLSSITLNYNGVVSLSSNSLDGVTGPVTVYVPSSKISSYQTATNWVTLYNNNVVTFSAIPE